MAQAPLSPLEKFLSEQPQAQERGIFQGSSGSVKAPSSKVGTIPADLLPAIAEAAKTYDVPANILAGMADKESSWNSRALGVQTQHGRAKGLMQYLDDTAQGMGINAYDPVQSIQAAAKQLRERLDKGYDIKDAIREHFAGPNRAGWGSKTADYGDDVLARAGQYTNAFAAVAQPSTSPEQAPEGGYTAEQAQQILADLNKDEPGRYAIATPEQIAQFEARQPKDTSKPGDLMPEAGADFDVNDPAFSRKGGGKDGALSAIGKSLRNIPGNFQEAAAGQLRSFGEGIDDQTLVIQAAEAGIIDKLRADGIITMSPAKSGLLGQNVPTLPNGREADTASLAQYLRENAGELGLDNADQANTITQAGQRLGKAARKDRLEINPDGPLAKYSSLIIGSTAEMVPALLAAAATKSPGVAMGMIGGQVYGQGYERARESKDEPQNPSQAASYAMAQAVAEAIPSALPVHAILAPGANFFKGLFKAGTAEAIQESVTGAIQAGIDKGTIDPNMTWEQAGQQVFDSMVAGFGAGTALRAGTEGVRRGREAMRSPERDLGNALNESVESTDIPGDAQQAAVDALDPNTYAQQPAPEASQVFDPQTGEVLNSAPAGEVPANAGMQADITGESGAPAPAGPLSRAAAAITPEAPASPTAPVQGSALTPDVGADAFAGEPGTLLSISIDGIEPFRARLEGYVDGEAMLVDDSGDRFQLTRDELAGATVVDEGRPSVEADTGAPSVVDQAIQQDAEPPLLTDVVSPGVEIPTLTEQVEVPTLTDVVAPGVEIPTLTDVVEAPAAEPTPPPAQPALESAAEPESARSEPKPLEDQSEAELRESLKYLARQAKSSGGWNKPLMTERRRIESAIAKAARGETETGKTESNAQESASDAKKTASDAQESASNAKPPRYQRREVAPTSAPVTREQLAGLSDAQLAADTLNWYKRIGRWDNEREGGHMPAQYFNDRREHLAEANRRRSKGEEERDKRAVAKRLADQPDAPVQTERYDGDLYAVPMHKDMANGVKLTLTPEEQALDARFLEHANEVRANDTEFDRVLLDEWEAMAKAAARRVTAKGKPTPPPENPTTEPGRAVSSVDNPAPVKWFGSQAKADGYLAGRGLGDTHEVVKQGVRYEIRPKGEAPVAESAPAKPAGKPERKKGESVHAYRARLQLGADVGGTVTPSADIGYAPGGQAYTIRNINGDGTVYIDSPEGSTSWSRAELERAKRQGVTFSPTEAPTKAAKPTKAKPAPTEPVPARSAIGVDAVRGEPIDSEWTAFNAASGTRWVPRADMPQVKAEHRGALVNFLNARGIEHSEVEVPASQIKATQAEFSPERVQRAKEYDGGQRAILISSDNHVVDGHHQWLAELDMGGKVRAIQLDAPIEQVLEQVRDFPSSTVDEGSTTQTVAEPSKEEPAFGSEAYWQELADQQAQDAAQAKPAVTENKIFTEDAAAKARALLKSKLTQLNSGIDPEIMQAGITLAGYHIEKGARTFAAYAKAMTADLGDLVKPYLKSWYMGVKYDPRAKDFDNMSTAAEVEGFDVDQAITTEETTDVPSSAERVERDSQQPGAGQPVNAAAVADASRGNAERPGEPGADAGGQRGTGQRDNGVHQDGAPVGRERGDQRVHQRDGEYQPSQRAAGGAERAGGRDNRNARPATERKRAKQIARDAVTTGTGEFAQRLKAQKAAVGSPTSWADPTSIDAALPLLLPEQRGDVLKAEMRLADHNGMLNTNGTGTGKTASGLGLAMRYHNAGKTNIAIVVPTDKISADWVKFAGMIGMPLKKLDGINDNGGSGPVITTYANFGQNNALAKRNWDLIINDESHYLSSNEDGDTTAALDQLRALTGHHGGMYKWMQGRYSGAYQLRDKTYLDLVQAQAAEKPPATIERLEKAHQDALKAIDQLRARVEPRWQKRWESQQDVGRVLFLSATPFAYQKSVQYAEGYLFDYLPPADLYRREGTQSQAYNAGDAYQRFMMQHFGYRMRYNKLTQPESGVDSQIMERQFHSWLQDQGALSGRRLEVPFDYDRKFITVDDAIGTKIDDALRFLREGDEGAHKKVYDAVMSSFDYQSRMYLLEALKARAVVPMIRDQLAAGRKVVVFHDFNKGGAENPFVAAVRNISEPEVKERARQVLSQPMFQFDMGGLMSPLETLADAFPDALLFNGTVSKAKRRANADRFNDDATGPALIVVQSDAGREGVSLHDTTGKHPRVEYNLGMPTKPVAATQIEGRIYRTGQASDAAFRYLTTGTGWEASAFASKIAERASTAENLALGEQSRDLKQAFIDAYNSAEEHAVTSSDGRGGKERDRGLVQAVSPFERAKSFYWAQAKNSKRRDQREGADYFATAEPVGFKKVQWADIKPGESVLEPSAGHGAIARFFPEQSDVTMIEPSYDLSQRAALANGGAKIVNDTFESHHITNKYNAIVMNPPFGSGGKTAIEHLAKAARHLSEGGRIVATIPRGGMADRRLDAFFADPAHANLHTVADIELPGVAFERAGTGVNTRVLVLERHAGDDVPIQPMKIDLSNATTANELFDRLENLDLPPRLPLKAKEPARASLLDGSGVNGNRYDAPTLERELRAGPLGDVLGPLLDSGQVTIHETAPAGVHDLTQGWTDTSGNIHLVASQLTSDTAQPVLMHEAFHTGADALMGTTRWTNLMARLNGFHKAAASGSMKGEWADAYRRVQAAQDAGDTMSQLRAIEEMGAYAVENFEKAPPGIRKWVDSVLGVVKDWLARRFGIQVGDMTPAQLRALAVAALRSGTRTPRNEPVFSLASQGTTMPSEKAADSWFSQKLTDAMAGPRSSGQYSLLALAPMDRMIEELTKDGSSARKYLEHKRAMDAYRNDKHRTFDDIAQEWLKLNTNPTTKKHAEDMAVLMHDATIAQIDPAKPLEATLTPKERQIVKDKPDHPLARKILDDMEARRPEYDALRARFVALPERVRKQYIKVRDAYKAMTDELDQIIADNLAAAIDLAAKKAARDYQKRLDEIRDDGLTGQDKTDAIDEATKKYNTAVTKGRMNKKARMTMLRQKFESNRLNGPYFPLSRFGDYFVTVRDADGKVLSFSRFESKSDQAKYAARQKGKGKVETGLLSNSQSLKGSVDARFVQDIEEILGKADINDSVRDQVWQRYLESMPDFSLRKGFIHRKNREGYTQDATRAFAHKMFHSAHQMGRLKYGNQMQEALDDAQEQAKLSKTPERDMAVANELGRRHDYVMNPKGGAAAQALTSAAFVYQLSMSPAAALVNLAQTVMVGIPVIGAQYGVANTANQLAQASADFGMGRGQAARSKRLTADEKAAMQSAYQSGLIESTQSHNLAGVGDGVGVRYSAVRNKVMGVISWAFHQAERLNREVTYLAAYRMARKAGESHAQAMDSATSLTYKTHFDYANTNRPRVMHGDTAKVMLVFRNYQVNMLWRLFRDTHQALHGDKEGRAEAVKQLGGMTGMMALNAGIKGTWMYGIAMVIASMLFGDDAEDQFKKGAIDALGPTAAGLLLNGVPGHASGLALSERIGMPDLWFRSPDRQMEGKDEFNYWQSQLLGFLPTIAQNMFVGYQQASDGNIARGLETASPKAVKDLMRAYRYGSEGATTLKGDQLVSKFTPWEMFAQAMGFTPAVLAEQYDRNNALKSAETRIMDKRRTLMTKYATAYRTKDGELKTEAMAEIKEFNRENKRVAISPANLASSIRSRQLRGDRTEGGIYINPKLDKQLRDTIAPAIYR